MSEASYSINYAAIAYASGKSMLDVFQTSSGTNSVNVYQCLFFNNGTASVTGVLTTLEVQRHIAASSGTTVTPIKFNSASASPAAAITGGTNRTTTTQDTFRRLVWSNDEPAVSGASMDEWELQVSNATIWSTLGDSRIEPLTCRSGQNEGIQIKHTGTSAVGSADAEIIFTIT